MTREQLWELFQEKGLSRWGIAQHDLPPHIPDEFFPAPENVFKALEEIFPEDVNYLILGQDPYWTTGDDGLPDATGIAFAVPTRDRKTPSLSKIMGKIGCDEPDLKSWREKHGVLLLNAALTVPHPQNGESGSNYAGAHLKYWDTFTRKIVTTVSQKSPGATLIAWGSKPRDLIRKALKELPDSRSKLIWCYHPQARYVSKDHRDGFEQFWDRYKQELAALLPG